MVNLFKKIGARPDQALAAISGRPSKVSGCQSSLAGFRGMGQEISPGDHTNGTVLGKGSFILGITKYLAAKLFTTFVHIFIGQPPSFLVNPI
jgi:hypothetical protein